MPTQQFMTYRRVEDLRNGDFVVSIESCAVNDEVTGFDLEKAQLMSGLPNQRFLELRSGIRLLTDANGWAEVMLERTI